MSIAYEAMMFAREAHKDQKRKYTGNPYFDHLAEVVGISISVGWHYAMINPDISMAVGWLHDTVEDTDVDQHLLKQEFGEVIAGGVFLLSDPKEGNRAERKAVSRHRLAGAPHWVQTIKVADLISNTSSIVQHDPNFAKVYLQEKRLLLEVMTKADHRLVQIAREQITEAERVK